MIDAADERWMARALQLAQKGLYTTMPNPRVGCVLVRDKICIGEGWHQRAGLAHAEVNALAEAGDARGATAYVTLEPCNHTGRTGPCSVALIDAGVARVVYATQDPNPQVAGAGLARLAAAGVCVDGPVLEAQAQLLNRGFIKRMQSGLPWLTVKLAMSLDGRTAMASGESQWITAAPARADVQRLRARSCAIVTGIDTVLHDDAALTVRANELGLDEVQANAIAQRQPLRVVLDRQSRLPLSARILAQQGPLLLVQNTPQPYRNCEADVSYLQLPPQDLGVDLQALLQQLAARHCNEVLVESGAKLAGAFMAAGLVDELVVYMAPTLLGSAARPLLELPLQAMAQQQRLTITDVRAVGADWRITAQPQRD